MYLAWRAVTGQMPRLQPHLLPEMAAQVARNTILWRGGVEALRKAVRVAASNKGGEKLTIYRDGQHLDSDTLYWLTFTKDVDITRGPVVDDELGRLFYTGDGVPKMTNSLIGWSETGGMPLAFYNLGIPAPVNQPNLIFSGDPTEDAEPISIVVAYAYVSADGFVGPLSPGSIIHQYRDGVTLQVSTMSTGVSGAYNLAKKYVYVAATDSQGATAFRFWKEVPLAQPSVSGTIDFTLLGEEPDTPSLIPPPDDMFGLMLHPNGFLVGFTTRKFLRSEVFKPHGWPSAYQDPIGDDIVGGAIIGNQVIICTKGKTYSAVGNDPLNQQIEELAGHQPCVSKRSIKAMPFGIVYASPDGLVLAGGMSPLVVLSEAFFTREQWQAYNPASMHACVHDRILHLFWKVSESSKGCLMFEFEPDGRILRVVESDQWFSAAYTDRNRDEMYVAGEDGDIWKWNVGDRLTTLWRSREIRMPRPENIGAVRIVADAYPIRFRLYDKRTDGKKDTLKLVADIEVKSDRPERLFGRDRYQRVHWEIETKESWTQVELGSSIHEILRNG